MGRWNNKNNIDHADRSRWHGKDVKVQNGGKTSLEKAYETFASMMIEKIKSVQNNWEKPWFSANTIQWPQSMYGKHYNGSNAIMLMLLSEKEGYKIPVFGTFERFTSLNFKQNDKGTHEQALDAEGNPLPTVKIKQGAKSFPIILPTYTVVHNESREKIKYSEYRNLSEEEKKEYKMYSKLKVYLVFNIEQTNLRDTRPELYQKYAAIYEKPKVRRALDDMLSLPAIDKLIEDNMFVCPIYPQESDNAYYHIEHDEIIVPLKEQFKDGESYYNTLFHEMTHATGKEGITGRLKPMNFGSPDYAREELVAEMTSALISVTQGIDKHLKDDSASYLKSWLASLNENPEYIKTVLTDVRAAATVINSTIEIAELQLNQENANGVHLSDDEDTEEDRHIAGVDMNDNGEVEYSESHEEKEKKFVAKR